MIERSYLYPSEWKIWYLVGLVLTASVFCSGATYYLDTSSAGDGDGTSQDIQGDHAAWDSISDMTGLLPGDAVLFRRGQQWNQTLTIDFSGESGNKITFGAYGEGFRPLIDVSGNVYGAGIVLFGADYIEISDFDIKGSGGEAALAMKWGSEKTGSGADGQGFTIVIRNVSVLSNYGAGEGNNDGFSLHAIYPDGSSQALFYNISATKCRHRTEFRGSHQAFTAHERCKAKVYTANFSECVNWYAGVQNSQVEFYDLTASSNISLGFTLGDDAGSDISCLVSDSNLTIGDNAKLASIASSVSRQGDKIVIADSLITSNNSELCINNGNLTLLRNIINIDDPGWRFMHNGGLLTLKDNIINCTDVADWAGVFDVAEAGQANVTGNLFKVDITGTHAISFATVDPNCGTSLIENNIFKNFNDLNSVIKIADDSFTPVVSYNVFYNDIIGGKAMELANDGDEADVSILEFDHNIFYNIEDVLDEVAGGNYYSSYNCYYMSENIGGIGCIEADPLFVNPDQDDFHLKSQAWRLDDSGRWTWDDVTSRCIDAGNPSSVIEAELMAVPYDPNNDWGINVRTNIGAYGRTSQASMATYQWSLLGDINNDGIVDMEDVEIMTAQWLLETSSHPGDLNRDGIVGIDDLKIILDQSDKETIWTYKAGMIDDDYDIDIDDLVIILQHWLETNCGTCGGAELTGDGNVDLADFVVLAINWLHGVN